MFVVAKLVQNRGMLDEDRFERGHVARDLVSQDLQMPFSKKLFKGTLEIRTQGARSAEARGAGFPCHHLMEASMA
jgi:hypothetical protein